MYNIDRFKEPQEKYFDIACNEVSNGLKQTHWIWFIFPQLKGLGFSLTSEYYGLENLEEAIEYYNDVILRNRLNKIVNILLKQQENNIEKIFGQIDAVKVKSCLTLFDLVKPNDIFSKALKRFYNGEKCEYTINNFDVKQI